MGLHYRLLQQALLAFHHAPLAVSTTPYSGRRAGRQPLSQVALLTCSQGEIVICLRRALLLGSIGQPLLARAGTATASGRRLL